jgi:hypothetical protein
VELIVGREKGEHVAVRILGREGDAAGGDWLEAEVAVRVGAFEGRFAAALTASGFATFRRDVEALTAGAAESARFAADEGWLVLGFEADERGQVTARGEAQDDPGNVLQFHFRLDAGAVASLIAQLRAVESAYPPPATEPRE